MKAKFLFTSLALFLGIIQGYAISGSGTSSSPYLIYTASDLVTFRNYVNNGSPNIYGKLMADIDLSSVCSASKGSWTPIGNGNPVTGSGYLYKGQFNGNYHTISGLYINVSAGRQGLFGTITGLVYRLTVSGTISVSSNTTSTKGYIGGVVGYNKSGRVASCNNNCVISGDISAAGGVVGMNEGSIYNCTNEANITGRGSIGGIVGEIQMGSSVEQCTNNGTIASNSIWYSGGIIGYGNSLSIDEIEALGGLPNTTIINCINNGNIEGDGGGIISVMSEGYIVEQCVNNGTISANSYAGGITYEISGNSTISNCYNSGTININSFADFHVGGIAAMVLGTESYDESLGVWIDTTKPLHIQNCYNIGTINIPSSLGKSGGVYSRDNTISPLEIINSYCLNSASTSAGGGIFKDANAFQNGEVAYLLQQGQSSQYWGQTLGSDNSPIFSSDESNKVYRTTFIYNNETVFVKYRNENYTTSSFPTDPELAEIGVTHGYYTDSYGATINTSSHYKYNSILYIYDIEGEGSASAPFLIHEAKDLVTLRDIVKRGYSDRYAKLTADIDLSSVCGETIGSWTPIGSEDYKYRGVFDGDGHKISNLYINSTASYQGLFGDNYGTIKNLTISGYVKSTATVVGGVVGLNEGHIINCTNLCSVSGEWTVGGIAGHSKGWDGDAELEWETTITNCTNKGIINLTQNTNYTNYYGSIAGVIDDKCTVSNCIDYTGIPFVGYSWGGEVIGCTHLTPSPSIAFADANVKALCVANWDTNGDGELSKAEAAAVTDLGEVFRSNKEITSFNELKYFTGLTSIVNYTFIYCYGLASVTIPSSVTNIGSYAFSYCYNLTNIVVDEGNGVYDSRGNCNAIIKTSTNNLIRGSSSTIIPSSVTSIGYGAFNYLHALTSINIPSSITSIAGNAFSGCINLTSITVDAGNSNFDSRDNCNAIIKTATNTLITGCMTTIIPSTVTSIGDDAFYGCTNLTSISIPSSVTSIGNYVFSYCNGLTDITIPSSVISLGDKAFDRLSSLISVKVDLETPLSITENTFSNRANATLYVPAGCKAAYKAADYWKEFKKIVETVEIGDIFDAPIPCDDATVDLIFKVTNVSPLEVEVSASPEDIAGALIIPATVQNDDGVEFAVTGIGCEAFMGRQNLTTVTLPEGVTVIKDRAFDGCENLESVMLPSTLRNIYSGAFWNCVALSSINLPAGMSKISLKTFQNTPALKSIELPEGLTTIEYEAFKNSGLESITFPSTLTAVDYEAFWDCKRLASIDFNRCEAHFAYNCFYGCSSLEELSIPNTVKFKNSDGTWSWTTFGYCTSLRTVVFEAFEEGQSRWSTTSLFADCAALETVVLPSTSVMQKSFFLNCSNLQSVTYLEVADDFDPRQHNFNKMYEGLDPNQIQFTVPTGTAETLLKAGYMHLSDKSGLSLVQAEFEAEATRIAAMADELTDGDKTTLSAAISNANAIVEAAEDYATVYTQMVAIKSAAKVFLATASIPANFNVTAAFVSNPDFDNLQIDWHGQLDWPSYPPHAFKQGLNEATFENDNVTLNKFYDVVDIEENRTLSDGFISQTITNLPVGNYRLEADLIATWQDDANVEVTGVNLFAGTVKTAVATENQKPQHFTVEFTQYKEGNCTIGIDIYNTTANWVAMDNVRLYWLGGDVPAPVVDEDATYYIQNVETGKYMHQGNKWETHAVLSDEGLPVRITQQADGSYTFYFLEGSGHEHLLFRDDGSDVYVDYNSTQDRQCPYWTITAASEEGTYHIQSLVTDSRYGQQVYPGTYLGNNPAKEASSGDGNGLGVYNDVDGNIPDEEGMNIIWRFVSESVYKNETAMYATSVTTLAGGQANLSINLRNDEDIIMAEFYMQLPDGLSIVEDEEGYPDCTLNSERSDKHTLEVSQTSGGLWHFLIYSSKNNVLKGNDGELVSVRLACDGSVSPGDYEGVIRNILLSDSDKNSIWLADTEINVTISDAVLGDINGDGDINGLDIVEMVDHIMGRESESFIQLTSDLNFDGKINGVDLVKLVRLVMEQDVPQEGPSNVRARIMSSDAMTLEDRDEGLSLGVASSDDFILAQCIVELSEGMELEDVNTDASHTATWLDLGKGRYAVLAYSMRNALFADNDALLTLKYSGMGDVNMNNVMLVDTERKPRLLRGANFVTGIMDVEKENRVEGIYDLQGRKRTEAPVSKNSVYVVNGKKVLVK